MSIAYQRLSCGSFEASRLAASTGASFSSVSNLVMEICTIENFIRRYLSGRCLPDFGPLGVNFGDVPSKAVTCRSLLRHLSFKHGLCGISQLGDEVLSSGREVIHWLHQHHGAIGSCPRHGHSTYARYYA